MESWEHQGRKFRVVMASNVIRDGMSLELTDLDSSDGEVFLEAFWHDDSGEFEFIAHRTGSVPFEVLERFIASARENLPPSQPTD